MSWKAVRQGAKIGCRVRAGAERTPDHAARRRGWAPGARKQGIGDRAQGTGARRGARAPWGGLEREAAALIGRPQLGNADSVDQKTRPAG